MPSKKTGLARTITAQAACRADLAGSTLDLWPLYLFHPGALTLNFALTIKTTCRITVPPTLSQDGAIHFKSLDTGREESFSKLDELLAAKSYKHPIGAWLTRAFFIGESDDRGIGGSERQDREPKTRGQGTGNREQKSRKEATGNREPKGRGQGTGNRKQNSQRREQRQEQRQGQGQEQGQNRNQERGQELSGGFTGFTLETHSESPAGAGISGSSALMIATTAALARLTGRKMDREAMRVLAQNVEAQIINVPTGCQDYYPALYGGVNAIHLREDGIRREALPVEAEEIERRFVLVYTGAPRQSGINNWEVFKAHIDGDKKVVRNFESISQIAQQMHPALAAKQWDEVARLLREEWKLRKSNYKGISTPQIETLIKAAMKRGGVAAKVCGAGGGGCVVVMTEAGATESVSDALRKHGGQVLDYKVEREGVRVKIG
jgi:D-glycero-alpha-D-manno-heptose-7-phosphate kinase